MRIPSSLNDDNLYRRGGRPAAPRQSQRRILRLLLAMALVIAVMRQAGNPRIYELFFSEPPATLDTAASRTPGATGLPPPTAPPPGTAGAGDHDAAAQVSTQAAVDPAAGESPQVVEPLDRTIAALDEATIKRLIGELAEARRGEPHPPEDFRLPEDLVDALQEATQAAAQRGHPGGELAPALRNVAEERRDGPLPAAQRDWSQPSQTQRLQAALDQWAVDQVDPAAVWKASDTLAFYRLLEDPESTWLRRQSATRASVISLLQQPEVYLHRRVIVPGSVARAIPREAADNPFGISDYWELWLRPRDGSEHPLVFFTANVPPEIARIAPDASLGEGPPVWIEGVYLKRIAYRSAAGRQLAPALVGLLHPVQAAPVASETPASPPPASPSGWQLLALAVLLGGVATLLIVYQTRKEASRTRALRRSIQTPQEPLLGSVSDNQAQHPGAGK